MKKWVIKRLSDNCYYKKEFAPTYIFVKSQKEAFRFSHQEDAKKKANEFTNSGFRTKVIRLKKASFADRLHTYNKYSDVNDQEDLLLKKEEKMRENCDAVEKWIRELYPEGCTIDIEPSMNEFKVSSKAYPVSYDYGSLYDSLHGLELDAERCGFVEPKIGTVFIRDKTTYVVTSVEKTQEGQQYVFVTHAECEEPEDWGTLKSYSQCKRDGRIKIIWEPK
jgi:hypothetical protein